MALSELEFGPGYPKINALWKRTPNGKRVIPGAYATKYLEDLYLARWTWTEKIDGTNIGLRWLPEENRVVICGKTANAAFHGGLYARLEEIADPDKFRALYGDNHVKVFGEGYGAGIQKGSGYLPHQDFIVFDVQMGNKYGISASSPFMGGGAINDAADMLGVPTVNVLDECSIAGAWSKMVDHEYESTFPGVPLEGIVGRPVTSYYVRFGEEIRPVLCKLKYCDVDALD
jgi:hypothetical protein